MKGGWHFIPVRLARPRWASSPETEEQTSGFLVGVKEVLGRNSREMVVDFPGGPVVGNLLASARDTGSIPSPEDPTCRGATKPVSHNY